MTLPGETISTGASDICCGAKLELEVLQSAAGWYIGTMCDKCGPYSRESVEYYGDRETAEWHLDNGSWTPRS